MLELKRTLRALSVAMTVVLVEPAVAQLDVGREAAQESERVREARRELFEWEMQLNAEEATSIDRRRAFLLTAEHALATFDAAVIEPTSSLILGAAGVPKPIADNYYAGVRSVTDIILGERSWQEVAISLGIGNTLGAMQPGLGYVWNNAEVQYEYGGVWMTLLNPSGLEADRLSGIRSTLAVGDHLAEQLSCRGITDPSVIRTLNYEDYSNMRSQNDADYQRMIGQNDADFENMRRQNDAEYQLIDSEAQWERFNEVRQERRTAFVAAREERSRWFFETVRMRREAFFDRVHQRRSCYDGNAYVGWQYFGTQYYSSSFYYPTRYYVRPFF